MHSWQAHQASCIGASRLASSLAGEIKDNEEPAGNTPGKDTARRKAGRRDSVALQKLKDNKVQEVVRRGNKEICRDTFTNNMEASAALLERRTR